MNLTQFVNDSLEKYFSVSSVGEIEVKLEQLRTQTMALEQKKAALLASHESEDHIKQSSKLIWNELHRLYAARREQDPDGEGDISWISSPKNLRRCNLLGKKPTEVLAELIRWFVDG